MAKDIKKQIQHIDLSTITNHNIVKKLNCQECNAFCDDLRKYIVSSVAKNGGHLSSSLGSVDAIVSLCRVFDFDKDKVLFDVGHQCYAYKVLTGRSLDNLRQKDGTSGFQKLSESKYDVFEAGHSSTSISAANGMAIARDLNKENYDIIAFIGDASIVNGLAFEGLNNVSQGKHKIIIVLNDNNMSISRPIGGMGRFFKHISTSTIYNVAKRKYKKILSKTRLGNKIYNFSFRLKNEIKHFLIPTTVFDNMGFKFIGPIYGHDIKAMDKAFKRAQKETKSCVIHLRTIKGKGYKPAENDAKGSWHGVGPFDVATGQPLKASIGTSWSQEYAMGLHKKMSGDTKSILITPAMINGSCLQECFKDFRKRCFDVGIAEEHAFTMASGLALSGFHPVISIYSTFLQRGYDEMVHDVVRMNLNCTVLVDRAGLSGPDGGTHQGTFDESLIYDLPNTCISMALNDKQAKELLDEAFNFDKGLFVIRYPRGNVMQYDGNYKKVGFGNWVEMRIVDNAKTCVVSIGPKTNELNDLIVESNLPIDVYNAVYLKPVNDKWIYKLLKYDKIIIYNVYATKNGFAYGLEDDLIAKGYKGTIITKALPNKFISHGTIDQQLQDAELTPQYVFDNVINK